jgi:hypothetical protein
VDLEAGLLLHNYVVGVYQSGVSCLSSRLCVAVGVGAKGAEVQDVRDGVPGRVFAVRGERTELDAVSCAWPSGCIAVGSPLSGSIVYVVRIGRSGRACRRDGPVLYRAIGDLVHRGDQLCGSLIRSRCRAGTAGRA